MKFKRHGLPPSVAEWLMARSLPPADRVAVLGDLSEEYGVRVAGGHEATARRWYWRQVRRSLCTNLTRRLISRWRRERIVSGHPRPSPAGGVMRDLRFVLREFLRRPATPAIIVTTLALCLGAATTVFSIVNGLLLRPLPVREPEHLVSIESPGAGTSETPWTYAIWQAIAGRTDLFDGAAAWAPTRVNLAPSGEADVVDGLWTSGSFFDVLGLTPERGRFFTASDDARGAGASGFVVVLSDAFWRRHFGADDRAIGQAIDVGTRRATVIGVAPATFTGPEVGRSFDVALPLAMAPAPVLDDRQTFWLNILARLKPGEEPSVAQAGLAAAQASIRDDARPPNVSGQDRAAFDRDVTFVLRSARNGTSSLREKYTLALEILMAAVLAVVAIACSNIATLLLARATARTEEMNVRAALGASRARLVGSLFLEGGCLSIIGATLGLGLAQLLSLALVSQMGASGIHVRPDLRVIGFSLALAVGTTLLFGLAPALRVMRTNPGDTLKTTSRTVARGGKFSSTDAFLLMQLSLSLVLVMAATLLIRTFATLTTESLGFDADRLLAVDLQITNDVPVGQRAIAYEEARARAAAVPGVKSAALSLVTPLSGLLRRLPYATDGFTTPTDARAFVNNVSPEWFQTTGMPLLAGRSFTDADRGGSPNVIVVNEAFAKTFFGGANPVGRLVYQDPSRDRVPLTIVGEVPNSYYRTLRETLQPIVFVPIAQAASMPSFTLTVRVAGTSAEPMAKTVDAAVGQDRRLKLVTTTYRAQIDGSLKQERIVAWLSGAMAAIALCLAAIGLYGIATSTVEARRRELGIRLMLGSAPGAAIRLVLRRLAWLILGGLVGGAAASLASTRYLAALLFGVTAADPTSLVLASALLAGVGMLAAWRPIRQATRIDPAEVLRTL